MSTYVIAEAGVNHNGSLQVALELIEKAAAAGADAVKFQSFSASSLVSRSAPKAAYQVAGLEDTESQFAMLQALELDEAAHESLAQRCERCGIHFLSTPFDIENLDMLVDRMGMPRVKVASGEITNGPFLFDVARRGLPTILSTGMSTLGEVETALGVLAFGYTQPDGVAGHAAFTAAYASEQGQAALQTQVTLLHCTSEYPTPPEDVHLRAMDTLRSAFRLPVGYSDHTRGIVVPIAAVARGAVLIEKHFTLDRTMPGPDHQASLEPDELAEMVRAIREVESALGRPVKAPTLAELDMRAVARRSLTAAREIHQGDLLSEHHITARRPGHGVSPMRYWEYVGTVAAQAVESGGLLE